jgi:hypothetical protein
MATVRNFEVMLGQTLNHSEWNNRSFSFENYLFYKMKCSAALFSWHDKGRILKSKFNFITSFYEMCFEY